MITHFFGESGLTSTSANHIANLAKEAIAATKEEISSIHFFGEKTEAAGVTYVTKHETNKTEFNLLESKIKRVQDLTKLIAWLREALKEKDSLEVLSLKDWAKENGIEIPLSPQKEKTISTQDVISKWDVEKYNSFFAHQTNASVIGELIHPTRDLFVARKEFFNKLQNPIKVANSGRDLTVTTMMSSYTKEEVDSMFFKLQSMQRDEQSKYNKLKFEIDSAIENDGIEKAQKFNKEYEEYSHIMNSINAKYYSYVSEETKRFKNLKIIIPPSLQEIYKEVQNLGK